MNSTVEEAQRWKEDQRWAAAFHEAGHAVTAIALYQKFDYVSMQPRDRKKAVAHVWTPGYITANAIHRRGHWKAYASISAAGIIAEELYLQDNPYGPLDYMRKDLVRYSGQTDMKHLREDCLIGWSRSRENGRQWSATWVDPAHSPVDLAVSAWRDAAIELAVHWEAVEEVAEILYDSSCKVTYREIRNVVDGVRPDFEVHAEIPDEYLEPWFLEHSRLKWTPSDRWFADVERFAEMRRQHEAKAVAHCRDCGCLT